ncbi:hypothetical protein DVK02_00900 [Halobellus sp. Atlit-31R]|nr:hypothetical protein DVK02_00900 [Halobellus sp. Atlit-31R]
MSDQFNIDRRTALKTATYGIAGATLFSGDAGGVVMDGWSAEHAVDAALGPGEGVTLYAGQDLDVGTVTVETDDGVDELTVRYDTATTSAGEASTWQLVETHLHVAADADGIPVTRAGNPAPGRFAYTGKPDAPSQTVTYEGIDVEDLGQSAVAPTSVFVAAHAVVQSEDGFEETAWADGTRFTERGSWATYFEVDLPNPLRGRESKDPVNVVYETPIVDAEPRDVTASDIPEDAFEEAEERFDVELTEWNPETIHPLLQEWVDEGDPEEMVELVVTFRDDTTLPQFPEPATNEPRDSDANEEVFERTQTLIDEIRERREAAYFGDPDEDLAGLEELLAEFEAEIVDTFWIVKAVAVEMPLGWVEELAGEYQVQYVEPEDTGTEPPLSVEGANLVSRALRQVTDQTPTVATGRSHINSDPYFWLGLSGGWIGLLDTGVRRTHTLFVDPSNLDFHRDCVNGTQNNCRTGTGLNPDDAFWNHGTSTAAILMGNDDLGSAYRGVTGITVDSFDVYGNGGLNTSATLRGFEAALAVFDRVIVAEMQPGGNANSAIATAADNAYDTGALTVAANGNFGPAPKTVRCPANARRAIGVGALEANNNLAQYNAQCRGPAGDGRIKPDIQTPTNTETASNAGAEALRLFTGTSCATPYAAGAAGLLRNWLRGASASIDPGQVYAHLILSGGNAESFDNTSGAGLVQLPTDGWAWWGKIRFQTQFIFPFLLFEKVEIPLDVSDDMDEIAGATWMPKYGTTQRPIYLYLVDPSGTVQSASEATESVFQRVQVDDPTAGEWKLRLLQLFAFEQTVYFSAYTKR